MKKDIELLSTLANLPKKYFLLVLLEVFLLAPKLSASGSAQSISSDQKDNYWKAVGLFQTEEYAKALLYFQHILDQNSENYELNYYVGMCYYKLNRVKLSVRYFDVAKEDSKCNVKILILARGSEDLDLYSSL